MAQAGFTPIQLYYSSVSGHIPVSTDLEYGELGFNIADGILYYKNALGAVTALSGGGGGGGVSSFNGRTGSVFLLSSDITTALTYTPAATNGSNATGTWSINTSGNAATATTATNIAGGSLGSISYQTGAGATTTLPIGSSSQVLTVVGGVPAWRTFTATSAANISGGLANQIPYQIGAGLTSFISAPAFSPAYLYFNGSNFAYANLIPFATTAYNLSGGGLNRIPYQTAGSATAFLAAPTVANTFLKYDGANLTWGTLAAAAPATIAWNDVLASRALNTTYTNSLGYTITVNVVTNGAPADVVFYVNGNVVAASSGPSLAHVSIQVPPGDTYKAISSAALQDWVELY